MGGRRILIEGRPGSRKTTLARRLVDIFGSKAWALRGFTTEELRVGGRRVGFAIEAIGGGRAVLAHENLPGPPRIGRYGVDLAALHRIGLPALRAGSGLVLIDELGKMELASRSFREAVTGLFDDDSDIVATVHAYSHPFTDALKRRVDVRVLRLTRARWDGVLERLVRDLT